MSGEAGDVQRALIAELRAIATQARKNARFWHERAIYTDEIAKIEEWRAWADTCDRAAAALSSVTPKACAHHFEDGICARCGSDQIPVTPKEERPEPVAWREIRERCAVQAGWGGDGPEPNWDKLKGDHVEFGARVCILWDASYEGWEAEWETRPTFEDWGYVMGMPGVGDPEMDAIIHVAHPSNEGGKDVADAEWITLYDLLLNERVISIAVTPLYTAPASQPEPAYPPEEVARMVAALDKIWEIASESDDAAMLATIADIASDFPSPEDGPAAPASVPRWVPVEEKLPPDWELCHVWNGRKVLRAYPEQWGPDETYWYENEDGEVEGVTHWLPIAKPEPPAAHPDVKP